MIQGVFPNQEILGFLGTSYLQECLKDCTCVCQLTWGPNVEKDKSGPLDGIGGLRSISLHDVPPGRCSRAGQHQGQVPGT